MKKITGDIASPKGFYADGIHCGLKRKRMDMGWLYSEVPASAAAVFTTNKVKAAPVLINKEQIKKGKLRGIVVNSGNANACTGIQGLQDGQEMIRLAAEKIGAATEEMLVASTGIIGQLLPMNTIREGIQGLRVGETGNSGDFAEAILTTDTCKKEITLQAEIDGKTVTMSGCSKGSGMIHPNMATMLGFVTTDAAIETAQLQSLLADLTETTFNQITVDGDTSTNDMVLVLANGLAGHANLKEETEAYTIFKRMLAEVMTFLAKAIAKDGEGATKLIEVTTSGAVDDLTARMISKTVVGSPLVKTAMFGADPNWGRILCAVGYSGGDVDPEKLLITIGGQPVYQNGLPVVFNEAGLSEYLKNDKIEISVELASGNGQGKAWGCDLTYDYVKINALYHT